MILFPYTRDPGEPGKKFSQVQAAVSYIEFAALNFISETVQHVEQEFGDYSSLFRLELIEELISRSLRSLNSQARICLTNFRHVSQTGFSIN